MSMNIIAVFKDEGLTVKIDIRSILDNSLVVDQENMTEISDGAYKYIFAEYDETVDYLFICSDQNGNKVFTGNDSAQDQTLSKVSYLKKLESNLAVISDDGLSVDIYDDDQLTVLQSFTISENRRVRTPII